MGDDGARALARWPYLQHLTHLDLRGNKIDRPDRTLLQERFGKSVLMIDAV
jgi:hypothetical protein